MIHDKKKKMITIIEVGVTSQDQLQTVESEKKRKYDILAKELGAMHKCATKIIPFVLTWDGIVTKYHKTYCKELGITKKIEAYTQYIVLKKTFESISFDYRRDRVENIEEPKEKEGMEEEKMCAEVESGVVVEEKTEKV